MKQPSGELAAAGSGGISAVSLIAVAHRYGVELDPTIAGYLALAAGWAGARVRRYLAGESDTAGQHARRDGSPHL